jgi:hypothetical protein
MTTPERLQLLARAVAAERRGDLAAYEALRKRQLAMIPLPPAGESLAERMLAGAAPVPPQGSRLADVADRLAGLEGRLDARRKASPGQLALGLDAPPDRPGVPCGESFISADKTCRIGQAATPAAPPAAADSYQPRPITEHMLAGESASVRPEQFEEWLGALEALPGLTGEHARRLREFANKSQMQVLIVNSGSSMLNTWRDTSNLEQQLLRRSTDWSGNDPPFGEQLRAVRQAINKGDPVDPVLEARMRRVMSLPAENAGLAYRAVPLIVVHGGAMETGTNPQRLSETQPTPEAIAIHRAKIATATLAYSAMGSEEKRRAAFKQFMEEKGKFPGPERRMYERMFESFMRKDALYLTTTRSGFGDNIAAYIHEMGHQIDNTANRRSPPPMRSAYRGAILLAPSDYGQLNREEAFAESFVSYVLAPEALKIASPQTYEWVDSTVQYSQVWADRHWLTDDQRAKADGMTPAAVRAAA